MSKTRNLKTFYKRSNSFLQRASIIYHQIYKTNNLVIIYENGFGNEIEEKLNNSIEFSFN